MSIESEKGRAKSRTRIFLIEDHPIARHGLAQLINGQRDMVVCGEASGAQEALRLIRNARPDLAILDITLEDGNGLELTRTLKGLDQNIRVLVMSMHDEALNAEVALHAGASGYIMKEEAIEKVLVAIRKILSGKIYVSENITLEMLQKQAERGRKAKLASFDQLSERELQVFQMIGEWVGTQEIARQLHISVKTVEYYYHRIKQKLHLKNATDLRQYATEWRHRNDRA
ncbi:MAG TPA: response regulator transcription factor [Candidatus Dormibacteraeota bacterium]|nr:response regulator transcription factor [Candidatus Dormibacteraeota bacterium]